MTNPEEEASFFAGIVPQHPRFVYDRQILN